MNVLTPESYLILVVASPTNLGCPSPMGFRRDRFSGRTIAELMFVDFTGVAMDQIANRLAKDAYTSGGNGFAPSCRDETD